MTDTYTPQPGGSYQLDANGKPVSPATPATPATPAKPAELAAPKTPTPKE